MRCVQDDTHKRQEQRQTKLASMNRLEED